MRLWTAFKQAVKYHSVASLATLLGVGIAVAGLWVGLVEPVLQTTPTTTAPRQLLQQLSSAQYNLPLAAGAVVIGLLVRRVLRTTLLFKTHGTAVVEVVDQPAEPSGGAASGGESGTTDPHAIGGIGTDDDVAGGDDGEPDYEERLFDEE